MVIVVVKTLPNKEGKTRLVKKLNLSRKKAANYVKKINKGYIYKAEIIYEDG